MDRFDVARVVIAAVVLAAAIAYAAWHTHVTRKMRAAKAAAEAASRHRADRAAFFEAVRVFMITARDADYDRIDGLWTDLNEQAKEVEKHSLNAEVVAEYALRLMRNIHGKSAHEQRVPLFIFAGLSVGWVDDPASFPPLKP